MSQSNIGILDFFQSFHFSIDKNVPWNEWPLSDEATIVFRRSCPLNSLNNIQGKQAFIVKNSEERSQERRKLLHIDRHILLTNDKYIDELLKVG